MYPHLYTAKLADELGVSQDSVKREVVQEKAPETKRNQETDTGKDTGEEELFPREKYLIKLVSMCPEYLDKIAENKGIIHTGLARRVMNKAYVQYQKSGRTDIDEIIDGLHDDDQKKVIQALGSVVIDENQIDQTYEDLVVNWKIDELTGKEKEILTSLSLADDQVAGDKVKEFQQELIEVQKSIRELKQRRR